MIWLGIHIDICIITSSVNVIIMSDLDDRSIDMTLTAIPANTRHWTNVGLPFANSLWRDASPLLNEHFRLVQWFLFGNLRYAVIIISYTKITHNTLPVLYYVVLILP